MKIKYLFILSLFILFMACEESFEYKVYTDPTVSISFINQDSISALENAISNSAETIEINEDLINELDSSLAALTDSLNVLNQARDTGNFAFDDILSELQLSYSQDSIRLIESTALISSNQTLIDSLNILIANFETGKVKLDFIRTLFENTSTQTFEDSLDTYELVLNVSENQSMYEIGIWNDTFSIALTHESEEFITADLGINLRISAIEVVQHDFDSVLVSCIEPTNCSAYETTLVCYY